MTKVVFLHALVLGLHFYVLIGKHVCQGETWKFIVFICFVISSSEDTMKFVKTEYLNAFS